MADLKSACALASIVFGATTLAAPAWAQFYERPGAPYRYNTPPPAFSFGAPAYRDERPLPPFAFVDRLEERGFVAITRPHFDGSVYVIDATSPRGMRVRFVFDAFRGDVVDRYALGPAQGPRGRIGAPRRYADRPDVGEPTAGAGEAPIGNRRALGPEPRRRESEPREPVQGLSPHAAEPNKETRSPTERASRSREVHHRNSTSVKIVPPTRPNAAPPPETAPASASGKAEPSDSQIVVAKPPPTPAEAAAPAISPKAPSPPVEDKTAEDAAKPSATAEVDRSGRAVRVIKGVTPMDVGPQPDTDLDSLPTPPAVAPPLDIK